MLHIRVFIKNLYIVILFYCLASSATSSPIIDEALLNIARIKGMAVYTACIVTPPSTPAQDAACAVLYAVYMASLQAVNAPFPLVISTIPSPYASSRYDVCRYEPAYFVFNALATQPYCPAR